MLRNEAVKEYERDVLSSDYINEFNDETQTSLYTSTIGESLLNQISTNPSKVQGVFNPSDFLTPILDRFSFLLEKYGGTELEKDLKVQKASFLKEIAESILNNYGLSETSEDIIETDNITILQRQVESLYEFFIISHMENLVNFFISYIINHTDEVAKSVKSLVHRKDFGFKSTRSLVGTYDEAIIIYGLTSAIEMIINEEFNQDQFFDHIMYEEEERISNITIREMFEIADFAKAKEKYLASLKTEGNSIFPVVENSLRNRLFSIFSNRKG